MTPQRTRHKQTGIHQQNRTELAEGARDNTNPPPPQEPELRIVHNNNNNGV